MLLFICLSGRVDGVDYDLSPAESKVTFGPSEMSKTLTITLYQDGIFEQTESFYLKVEPAAGETGVKVQEQPTAIFIEDTDSTWQ